MNNSFDMMDFNFMGEPTLMERLFPIFFIAIFCLILGTIIYTLISNAKQKIKNDASPRLSVNAKVVAKRSDVTYRGTDHNRNSVTKYYATFQVGSGDRMELLIPSNEYGYLVENDEGVLSFQGTRFLEFKRN